MYIRSNLINQMSSKKKIIILINTVTPYQIDFFESLRQKVNLKVIFYNKNYKKFGNSYSLFIGLKKTDCKTIIFDGDLVYSKKI